MRITNSILAARETTLNSLLNQLNINRRYVVSYRYNYTAIDYHNVEGKGYSTYETGLTKREAYNILNAMIESLHLVIDLQYKTAA